MTDRQPNSNANLAALPAELRHVIFDYVLAQGDSWVGYYAPLPGRSRTNESGQGYPPHVLSRVNRLFAEDIRHRWPYAGFTWFRVHDNIRYTPPAAFHGILSLHLTMNQAVQNLQVMVPCVPRYYCGVDRPATDLIFAHGLVLQQLYIRWHVDWFGTWQDSAVQTALMRLRYFSHPFTVRVDFWTDYGYMHMECGGAINFGGIHGFTIVFTYRGTHMQNNSRWRRYKQDLNNFLFRFERLRWWNSTERLATNNAHPHHDFVPLGWRDDDTAGTSQQQDFTASLLPPRRAEARPFTIGLPARRAVDLFNLADTFINHDFQPDGEIEFGLADTFMALL